MTLHLHHPADAPIIEEEQHNAHFAERTIELVNAILAVPDAHQRSLLCAVACGALAEAVLGSLPGGVEALAAEFGGKPWQAH